MATNQITGTITGNISVHPGGNYDSPLTVAATGAVTGGVSVGNGGTIVNYGQLNTGGNHYGVTFSAGGALINEAGGTILSTGSSPGDAVIVGATGDELATIDNFGTLAGNRGIVFFSGGEATNETGGVISGADDGIIWTSTAGTLVNDGSIASTGADGVDFRAGGTVTNESHGVITGQVDGISMLADGTVANAGTILGTTNGIGVVLASGGSIGNTGTIGGTLDGVLIQGATSTVDNSGTIYVVNGLAPHTVEPNNSAGVVLNTDGSVTNEAGAVILGGGAGVYLQGHGGSVVNQTGGTIEGYLYGVKVSGAAGTIDNHGLISATANYYIPEGFGVDLYAGGTVTNENDGTISAYNVGIEVRNAPATIDNFGTIEATATNDVGPDHQVNGFGIDLHAGGAVINETDGTISGRYIGIASNNGLTLTNASGATISSYKYAVNVNGAPATIDNYGTIQGGAFPSSQAIFLGDGGTVVNHDGGTISGAYGIFNSDGDLTVDNSGVIDGQGWQGILFEGGLITNEAGASITGQYNGVQDKYAAGTVINYGAITGTAAYGVDFTYGGTLSNLGTGAISGAYAGIHFLGDGAVTNAASATITGSIGIDGRNVAVTLDNAGSITGTASDGYGVRADSGAIYNHGHGTISGAYAGVELETGGSVTNTASASISGDLYGVHIQRDGGTVDNAGTISGSQYSVYFDESGINRLIIHAGAVFDGTVYADPSGTNTIELASSAVGGAITGLGTQYEGFQTITIDSGARWDIGGTKTGFNGTTITGFHAGDRLDITNLAFNTGETATVSSGKLIIRASSGTALETIGLSGNFSGHTFNLLSDGHGGSFVEEDGVACYCRGTRILTVRGEVAVEDLRIGDMVMTAFGAGRPIRWIGMRAYDGHFIAGRKDLLPVTIAAGALANSVPRRDLSVSPLHSMFIDGMLIPARALVDGKAITQADTVETVEYFHIELETHDVIVAEGAPSETFVDDGSRGMFHNEAEFARLYPGARRKPAEYCAPIVEDGEALETVRRRIAARHAVRTGEGRKAA